jgi:hypothetical protein
MLVPLPVLPLPLGAESGDNSTMQRPAASHDQGPALVLVVKINKYI